MHTRDADRSDASFEIDEHGNGEADVIHSPLQCIAATTVAGVPGEEATRERAGTVRIDDEKTFAI